MDKIDTIKVPRRLPRPAAAADVARVLAVICSRRPRKDLPLDRLRDRVLFETAYVCGAHAAEVCGLHVEDLDVRLDDEHVRIHGKGGTVRTVLLDDRGYVALLKLYLARAGYTAGPRSNSVQAGYSAFAESRQFSCRRGGRMRCLEMWQSVSSPTVPMSRVERVSPANR